MADDKLFTQEDLYALRKAAEQAWGDDTRHADFQAHPLPSAGQCYVTSEWIKSRYGGHIGTKGGHYFWVSPEKTHALDLTGDQFAHPPNDPQYEGIAHDEEDESGWTYADHQKTWRPGPVMFKQATHPLFKNFRTKVTNADANPRVGAFVQRANAALENPSAVTSKVALDYAGDAYPGEEPQALEDHAQRYWHDLPEDTPEAPGQEYRFFYGNGDLHVSPIHSHDDLRDHAGVSKEHTGPMAAGYVNLKGRRATWTINSNVGAQALARVLKDYTERVGWKWQGMTDMEGEPVGTGSEFAPKKALYYSWDDVTGHLLLSENLSALTMPTRRDPEDEVIYGRAVRQGGKLFVKAANAEIAEALEQYANDHEAQIVVVADVPGIGPGGGNFEDRLKNESPMGETLEQYDRGLVRPHRFEPREDEEPKGPFDCPDCGQRFPQWRPYLVHRQYEHQQTEDPQQDSGFPDERPDHDHKPLEPHFFEQLNNRAPFALASLVVHNPDPVTAPLLVANNWLRTASNTWKLSLTGQPPHSMIDDPIPVIFDIRKDELHHGQPGQKLSDIPGQFTPGGIVEGEYMPGGKLVLRSVTSDPYSVYHLGELWYWTFPHMELTGIEMQDDAGNTTKLAGSSAGQYIRQLALIDPAAAGAWRALREAGGKVYVVGGAVRDTLLQKEPKDLDLMVSGVPAEAVRRALEALPGEVNLTGKDFGVYRYRTKGHEVEIALPRTEQSTGDRRVDFDVQVDHNLPVESDLQRRDFTVNSMAVDLDSGELVDPYGGADDIAGRRLQTTHPNSFEEDATRLVRALVASSRHGVIPTERTRREIEQNAYRLDGEARERIQAELDKLFASNNPAGALRLAQETGLLKHLFPDMHENFDYDQNNPHHNYTLGQHSLNVLEGVQDRSDDPDLRLAAFLHDVGKPQSAWTDPERGTSHFYRGPNGQGANHDEMGATIARRWMTDMKYPVSRQKRVEELIRHHMYPDFSSPKGARKFLNRVGDHADDLMTLRSADREGKGTNEYQATKTPVDQQRALVEEARAQQAPVNQAALAVNGNDLMSAGIPQGPQIGKVLQQLTDAVVEDPSLNNPTTLLQLAQQYVQSG
jgi:tRNA nucleotidyltransferase (CCA-adding enzyme)